MLRILAASLTKLFPRGSFESIRGSPLWFPPAYQFAMNVAIIHYHLNRGGVMQVIANHLQAMDVALAGNGPLRVALVYGGRREGWPDRLPRQLQSLDVSLCEVPGLDYDQGDAARPERLHGDIKAALTPIGLSGHETLLHLHNHAMAEYQTHPRPTRA